jgi:hypothetical protein
MSLVPRDNIRAAVFSFLLPGLGHLYQHRVGRALSLFAAFTLLLMMEKTRVLIPILALGSSWDALRFGLSFREMAGRLRIGVFTIVAVVAFLAWMLLLTPIFFRLPVN